MGLLKGTGEGLAYALGHPVARALVIGLGLGVLFAAVDDVALVFLAREDLNAGALGYGLLVSVYGIGFALGSLALMRTRTSGAVAGFTFGLLLSGAGGLLTGLAPALGLATAAQAVAGSGNGLEVVATDTWCSAACPTRTEGGSLAWSSRRRCSAARSPEAWEASCSTSPPPGRPSWSGAVGSCWSRWSPRCCSEVLGGARWMTRAWRHVGVGVRA